MLTCRQQQPDEKPGETQSTQNNSEQDLTEELDIYPTAGIATF